MIKSIEVEVFGNKYSLTERKAVDVYTISEYQRDNPDKSLEITILVIQAALWYNIDILKWYQFFKKRKLKRLFSAKNLMNLHLSEITDLVDNVAEVEGSDDKKKVMEK